MSLAQRYYDEGADEVTLLKPNPSPDQVTFLNIPNPNPNPSPTQVPFLNITGFRDCPLTDLPMLKVRGLALCLPYISRISPVYLPLADLPMLKTRGPSPS